MIKRKDEITIKETKNSQGISAIIHHDLRDFDGMNEKVRMFSHVSILPNEKVNYHVHQNEFECYYVLSGKGLYNDNGEEVEITEGTITYTPSGCGHGLVNTGDAPLEFIALIVKD